MKKTYPRIPLSGPALIFLVAIGSGLGLAFWPSPQREGLSFWVFSRHHAQMYQQSVDAWSQSGGEQHEPIHLSTISTGALSRRTQAGFWAQTHTADLIEVELTMTNQFFASPVEDIGFHDLTDRAREDGLLERLNKPSLSAWSTRGRLFGLPHDVHPVLLCYRADLVEAAGIDVNDIETWDDFERIMRPLIQDLDGDGNPDRYLLGLWHTVLLDMETLLLQAGGGTFNPNGEPIIASPTNARVISRVTSWCIGPNRIAIDAPEFSPSGNQLKLQGRVVAALMPDWLAGVWMNDLPGLSGKLKLMPLPAWEPGGRRTSVMGGTMLSIPKTTQAFESAWAFAKELYFSESLAEDLFTSNHIISPVTDLWGSPFYHQPEPYFSGQKSGTLYIDQAPNVPIRTSSPYHQAAMRSIVDALVELRAVAEKNQLFDPEALYPYAMQALETAEARIRHDMKRNKLLNESSEPEIALTNEADDNGKTMTP